MQPDIFELGNLADIGPGPLDLGKRLPCLEAGENVLIPLPLMQPRQKLDRRRRQRHTVFLLSFRVGARLGPDPSVEVELIPGRLEDFAPSRAGQQQQPNDLPIRPLTDGVAALASPPATRRR